MALYFKESVLLQYSFSIQKIRITKSNNCFLQWQYFLLEIGQSFASHVLLILIQTHHFCLFINCFVQSVQGKAKKQELL